VLDAEDVVLETLEDVELDELGGAIELDVLGGGC
jgi:hypothetical protein